MFLPSLASDEGPLGRVNSIGTPALFLAASAALRLAYTQTITESELHHRLQHANSLLHAAVTLPNTACDISKMSQLLDAHQACV